MSECVGSSSEWECGVSVWSECVSVCVWVVQVNVSIGLDMNRYM